jgi:hypothetical protein
MSQFEATLRAFCVGYLTRAREEEWKKLPAGPEAL